MSAPKPVLLRGKAYRTITDAANDSVYSINRLRIMASKGECGVRYITSEEYQQLTSQSLLRAKKDQVDEREENLLINRAINKLWKGFIV